MRRTDSMFPLAVLIVMAILAMASGAAAGAKHVAHHIDAVFLEAVHAAQ